MKYFIARIKSSLQVEYSWKEFNTQEEENVMKKISLLEIQRSFLYRWWTDLRLRTGLSKGKH